MASSTEPSPLPPPPVCGAAFQIRPASRLERKRLKPNLAWSGEACEEEPLSAKNSRLDAAYELDVVGHARLERDDTTGVDAKMLADVEPALDGRAAGVQKSQAVTFEALHDKAFSAEERHANLLLKRDADRDAFGRAQERVLLRDELPPILPRSVAMILPG